MKNTLKILVEKYKKGRYDRRHKREALEALKVIENNTGYKLSKDLKKKINDYSKEVFGSAKYAYWLYVYTAFNQEFKEGWIPDNYFGYVVVPKVNNRIGKISNIKTLSKKIIQSDLLPDKYYLINGCFYDLKFNIIPMDKIEQILFEDQNEYYFKVDESNQGRGVIRITEDNFNFEELCKFGNAVIQTPIQQSGWFEKIVSGSVSTIRITTLKDKHNNIRFAASYLRVSEGKTDVVKSKQTIRIPVVGEDGSLGDYGYDSSWKRYSRHPETSFEFSGQKIPYFNNAVFNCIELHKKLPHFTVIGWDVSITDEGQTKIIEWNAGHPDIKFTEASVGPLFKEMNWESLAVKS